MGSIIQAAVFIKAKYSRVCKIGRHGNIGRRHSKRERVAASGHIDRISIAIDYHRLHKGVPIFGGRSQGSRLIFVSGGHARHNAASNQGINRNCMSLVDTNSQVKAILEHVPCRKVKSHCITRAHIGTNSTPNIFRIDILRNERLLILYRSIINIQISIGTSTSQIYGFRHDLSIQRQHVAFRYDYLQDASRIGTISFAFSAIIINLERYLAGRGIRIGAQVICRKSQGAYNQLIMQIRHIDIIGTIIIIVCQRHFGLGCSPGRGRDGQDHQDGREKRTKTRNFLHKKSSKIFSR